MTQPIDQPTEPQVPAPNQSIDTAPVTAQWIDIYENETAKVSVLLRNESVTRLIIDTEASLPLSYAVFALKQWNTDPRRHFELDVDQWVKTYWEGTQPRYDTTVVTTFRDLEWTVVHTEPGITVSVVEAEQQVTHVRIDWSPESDLELEEAGTVCFADNALHDWNSVPRRRFQLDEAGWKEVEKETEDGSLQFGTTVKTTFQTVLEVYIDTPEPVLHDSLIQTVVLLLSQQLPQYGVDFTSLYAAVQHVQQSAFARVSRTKGDNGEFYLEPENGWAILPMRRVKLTLETIEPILQAFEQQLAAPAATQADVITLRALYQAIAKEQDVDLMAVNSRRGNHLPQAYLQGTPQPPETAATTESIVEPTFKPVVSTKPDARGYLNLERAVTRLVEGLRTFEEPPFSAEGEGVTQRTAEEMAAYLIHTLLWQPSGIPGSALNGQVVQTAIDSVVSYYESEHNSIVAQQEEDAAAIYSEEPYTTEP